jgi:hypothetical protein
MQIFSLKTGLLSILEHIMQLFFVTVMMIDLFACGNSLFAQVHLAVYKK